MTQADDCRPQSRSTGSVLFVGASSRSRLCSSFESDGWLVVKIPPLGPTSRNQLADRINETIESVLHQRAAAQKTTIASDNTGHRIVDQLLRARRVGIQGIAIDIESISGLANAHGALSDEDSACLRHLSAVALSNPLELWLSPDDSGVLAYGPPDALERILGVHCSRVDSTTESGKRSRLESVSSRRRGNKASADSPLRIGSSRSSDSMGALAASSSVAHGSHVGFDENAPCCDANTPIGFAGSASRDAVDSGSDTDSEVDVTAALGYPAPDYLNGCPVSDGETQSATDSRCSADELRGLARMLDEASGPKPLSAIEKLFVHAYLPLAQMTRRGRRDSQTAMSLARFSEGFEKSYREAFAAATVTLRRPQMVFDAPSVAARIARLHSAKSTTLVVVDAMRFDVATRLERILRSQLRGRAALVERLVLWAALPATTSVQLRLLDKGQQALASELDTPELRDGEPPIGRGRTASTLRRLRVGGREILKLDVVQEDLKAPGPPEPQRLDALAQAASVPLVQLVASLSSRSLVFVFGDHGFVLPSTESGTGPAERDGARPEEVLVAGHAWIVGKAH